MEVKLKEIEGIIEGAVGLGVSERRELLIGRVKGLARGDVRDGTWVVIGEVGKENLILRGLSRLYNREVGERRARKPCPCCGQDTLGDLDY